MSGTPPTGTLDARKEAQLNRLGESLITQIFMLIRTLKIHDIENKALSRPLESLRDTINNIINLAGSAKLVGVEADIYINDQRIKVTHKNVDCASFILDRFAEKNIGELAFKRHVEVPELRAFLSLFSRSKKDQEAGEAAISSLQSISWGAFKKLIDDMGDNTLVDRRKYALRVYTRAVIALRTYVHKLNRGEMAPTQRLQRIVQELADITGAKSNMLLGLVSIRRQGDGLFHHSVNVTLLSLGLAQCIGLPRQSLADVGMAALLHDIGMTDLPDELLDKPAQLSSGERDLVSRHILLTLKKLLKSGGIEKGRIKQMVVASEHHHRFDAADRPNRPTAADFLSQIVAIADSFEALTRDRPWRKAFPPDEALQMMLEESGKKFDPVLLKAFVNLMGVYPMGSVVLLNNREMGVVYRRGDFADRPIVKILLDNQGEEISEPYLCNLCDRDENGQFIYAVARTLNPAETGLNVSGALLDGEE